MRTVTVDLDDLRRVLDRAAACAQFAHESYDWGRQMWTHEEMPDPMRDAEEAAFNFRTELESLSMKHPEVAR